MRTEVMPDGNTAALRQHLAHQDKLERTAPSAEEMRNMILEEKDRLYDSMDVDTMMEAIGDASTIHQIELLAAIKTGDAIEAMSTIKEICLKHIEQRIKPDELEERWRLDQNR